MTWQLLAHGGRGLLAAALGAIACPAIILLALESDGAIDAQSPSMVIMHIIFIHINILSFGMAILAAQRRMSQLYAYPVRTSAMVAWRLLPAMAVVAMLTAASTALLNALFNLPWPVWGPALFVAVALATVEAAVWLTEKSVAWLLFVVTVIAAVFGLWFKSRYGSAFAEPTGYWQRITPAELFSMLAMAVLAYWIAVAAVARNRRGEPPLSLGIFDRLGRYLEGAPSWSAWRNTPTRAHFWFEWRRHGWVLPAAAVVLLVFGLVTWLIISRDSSDLFLGVVSGGAVLWLISFIGGILLGNVGRNDSDFAMGQFLAARPMTDAQMAGATLRTAALSVFLAWLIWAAAGLIVGLFLLAAGAANSIRFPLDFRWWNFPGMLLGSWIVVGVLASIGLAGSTRVFQLVTGVVAMLIGVTLFSKLALSREMQLVFLRPVTAIAAGAIVLGTGWIFAAARRRALIQAPVAWGAAGVWAVATALVVLQWPLNMPPGLFGYLLVAAVFALAVAPLAAMPLALAVNRHR
jgi:hypothetical protein